MIQETIAHYKVLEEIARGGMGEVYLALDLTLDRKVALKLLPQEMEQDPSAQKRFLREAKAAAALDHPFIAHIHEVGEIKGKSYIAMEYVKGETLEQKLQKGPLPLEKSLQLGAEIAEALDEARQNGIIHRDLKPSNIMITEADHAKVMDFGLAKLVPVGNSGTPLGGPPTGLTASGVRLGTITYMSPEQLRGDPLDTRSDIFSFGILLYEMVTGIHPFKREDAIQTAGAILKEEPPPLNISGVNGKQVLSYILKKMLAKDPGSRYQTPREIKTDLLGLLNEVRSFESGNSNFFPRMLHFKEQLPRATFLLLSVLIASLALLFWLYKDEPAQPLLVSEIPTAPGERIPHFYRHGFALSPDGASIAIVSGELQNPYIHPDRAQIVLRRLDQWNALPLPKTSNASQPFFSPDGAWLGFSQYDPATNQWFLKRIRRDGGEPITVCECEARWGAAWTDSGSIIFGSENDGLFKVPEGSGQPERVTELGESEVSHRLPHLLPDGKGLLFTSPESRDPLATEAKIYALSFETGLKKYVTEGWDARYISSGHLLLARDAVLYAAPFELDDLEMTGEPVPVVEGVTQSLCTVSPSLRTGAAQFDVSETGHLLYTNGSVFPEIKGSIVWVDRQGEEESVDIPPRNYFMARLSPGGSELLATAIYPPQDVWLYDLERKTHRRQTFEGNVLYAIWGSDKQHFTFTSDVHGEISLFTKRIDSGPGQFTALLEPESTRFARPGFWNEASGYLTAVRAHPNTGFDIILLTAQGEIKPFLTTRFSEQYPEISPDGRWMVYTSNESGQQEVYVRRLENTQSAVQISTQGGLEPAWSRDGRELFYRWRQEFFRVPMRIERDQILPGIPEKLFEGDYGSSIAVRSYDVGQDGKLLLLKRPDKTVIEEAVDAFFPSRLRLVQNWVHELNRRVPGAQ